MSRLPIRSGSHSPSRSRWRSCSPAMSLLRLRARRRRAPRLASTRRSRRRRAKRRRTRAMSTGHVDPDAGGGTTLAQTLDARGGSDASTPGELAAVARSRASRRAPPGGSVLTRSGLPGTERRVARISPSQAPAARGVVVVARSLAPARESLDHLLRELLFAAPTRAAARLSRGLRPRCRCPPAGGGDARGARPRSPRAPALLPVPPSRDEISRLATTLNDMLARLHAAVEHERRFVADASHELRTPLALLRTELELALRRPRSHEELEEAIRSAAEETERLSRLAKDLLLIARADKERCRSAAEPSARGRLLDGVAGRFAAVRPSCGRTGRCAADAASRRRPRPGARRDRRSRTSSRTRSPTGPGEVELFAVAQGRAVELHVADEGAGFPTNSSRAPSTVSAAPTRRGAAAAPVSASRSSA